MSSRQLGLAKALCSKALDFGTFPGSKRGNSSSDAIAADVKAEHSSADTLPQSLIWRRIGHTGGTH
jgi:hypothetical protein